MASNHHSFEDFTTAIAWDAGKLLVMERVKVAPPKAMEMRIKVKYTSVYHTELCFYRRFGFPSQCSKTKNYPQLLFIGLAATKGGKISEALEYWGGVGGLEAQESTMYIELRKRPRHQPVQKLLIGLIADSTTNEHYNFQLDVGWRLCSPLWNKCDPTKKFCAHLGFASNLVEIDLIRHFQIFGFSILILGTLCAKVPTLTATRRHYC